MQHRPRKRFGQNFLQDSAVIQKILCAVDPRKGEHLVEIGPGQGALTRELLRLAEELDVVELDRDLVAELAEQCTGAGNLRVHAGDALRLDFCTLASEGLRLRVVGNLPYNISTPLLFHLLEQTRCIEDMHFMLQKEVVTRMAATPGSKRYGRLSLMVQAHCRVTPLFEVDPAAFFPRPRVDSTFVRLRPLAEPLVPAVRAQRFHRVVAKAFAQRRKTLRNSLRPLLDEATIRRQGIDPGLRAEQLTLAQFLALAGAISAPAEGGRDAGKTG